MVTCIGVSEPGAGSDVASIKTTAQKDGGDYVINGAKMWITNSLQADWMCLLANTSEGAAHKNKTLIILPMKTKGVTSAKKIRKIGMMSSDTGLIHFDDVRVPQRYRIGEEGLGFTYQMQQFQEERLWAAASSVHGMLRTLNDTIEYIRERKMFGQTVLDFQYVHYRLAELKTEIEALRALDLPRLRAVRRGGTSPSSPRWRS
jgi:citronellyl-CoA dehydrogenase